MLDATYVCETSVVSGMPAFTVNGTWLRLPGRTILLLSPSRNPEMTPSFSVDAKACATTSRRVGFTRRGLERVDIGFERCLLRLPVDPVPRIYIHIHGERAGAHPWLASGRMAVTDEPGRPLAYAEFRGKTSSQFVASDICSAVQRG